MLQRANHSKTSLWFTGICDDLYIKVALWDQAYWYGEVHSTRQYLDPKSGGVIDKPTRCAHKVPLRLQELDHLIRILETLRPDSPILKEFVEVKSVWKYGQPVQGYKFNASYWSKIILPPGLHRAVTLAFYPEHVKELLAILTEAKTGQRAVGLDAVITSKKQEGKDLFEE